MSPDLVSARACRGEESAYQVRSDDVSDIVPYEDCSCRTSFLGTAGDIGRCKRKDKDVGSGEDR